MIKKISVYTKIFVLTLLLVSGRVSAEENHSQAVSPQDLATYQNDIERIENYLNAIKTLVAPFTQTSSDDGNADGTFYLSRPGKLRWEYNPPTPILIIAKGSLLTYYDSELNQISHISLDDGLSGFLTRENISFGSNDISILKFTKENGKIEITISQKQKEEEGNLTLRFSDETAKLLGMTVTDAIGKTTTIDFITLVYDKPISTKLFSLPKVKK
ncbi:MAG: outer membrane lipoprotein carrier protein LolA [Rickettsiales bacterium]|nr:outer membrane lipoprotein carrier protein LolA [Pseudomonadota bacterium]MDA0966190.1 outer membrane lipoprotein carrier protein LolA [Pseudomonadota bacterium]MDG4543145.1 outer membrane lipoprotein carrier protein LolA [Rickettsiales bacterium]MDG4545343.1 outer membrane lipoprotein carrier protein LolA [Rickettsiales bacterium]MDG4547792.1 outer membrane lipoprotein carrier protein LolA [Rickettsiales bacterium]